jgi:hypothetical protein
MNDSVCRAGVKVLGASRVVVQWRGSAVVCSALSVSTAKLAAQGVAQRGGELERESDS